MKIQYTATGGAKNRIIIDGIEQSQNYSQEYTALAAAATIKANDPARVVEVDSYKRMRVEVTGVPAKPLPPPVVVPPVEPPVDPPRPPVALGLLDPAKLKFACGYRVPDAIRPGDTTFKSMAFSNLGVTNQGDFIWLTGHAGSDAVIKFHPPASPGTDLLKIGSWPLATVSQRIENAYLEVRRKNSQYQTFGLHYQDGILYVSGRDIYATGPQEPKWLIPIQLDPLEIKPAISPGLRSAAYGGGFVRIPQPFADQHCGGNTIGLSLGGYESGQNSCHSPSLAAWGPSPTKVLMESPFGTQREDRERRDGNYQVNSPDQWFMPPVDGVGVWTADNVLATTWVHTDAISSFVALVVQPSGLMDYNLQNRVFTKSEQFRLYVYDPADLAKVAGGSLKPWQVRGVWYSVPSIGAGSPEGMHWDGSHLNIVYQSAWSSGGTESYPIVAMYEVGY